MRSITTLKTYCTRTMFGTCLDRKYLRKVSNAYIHNKNYLINKYLYSNRDFCEISTKAFIHTDLVGQTFLCYLLPRSCKLQMVRINNFENKELQISTIPMTVVAKDAVALEVIGY